MKKRILILISIVAAVAVLAVGIWLLAGGMNLWQDDAGAEETKGKEYQVTFYANDGSVLKIDQVEEGGCATPPKQPQMLYQTVFCAWDTDFSQVHSDLEVRPVCQDVSQQENVVVAEGAYGVAGGTVLVPIRLCGQVCVAGLDMTVSYDSQTLQLLSVTEDGGVVYNDEVPGQIRLNYVSPDNTDADVDLCFLEFALNGQPGEQPITIEIHRMYAFQEKMESDIDTMYEPACTVMNGKVFVMQGGMIIEEN